MVKFLLENIVSARRSLVKTFSIVRTLLIGRRLPSLLKTAFNVFFRFQSEGARPFLLQVEPTSRCNLKCCLCPSGQGDLRRPKGEMDLDLFCKAVGDAEASVFYVSMYFMGEPLLNNKVFEMISYAESKRLFVRLSTNGELLNRENRQRLLASGLDEVLVSLDCVRAEKYCAYKGSEGFQTVHDNIASLIEERGSNSKPFVTLQMLAMNDVEADLPLFRQLAQNLKVDRSMLKTLRVNTSGGVVYREYLPRNKAFWRSVYKEKLKRLSCFRPIMAVVMLWDGSIVPCCFDMHGERTFGNIRQENFSDVWGASEYVQFRDAALRRPESIVLCQKCSLDGMDNYFVKYL